MSDTEAEESLQSYPRSVMESRRCTQRKQHGGRRCRVGSSGLCVPSIIASELRLRLDDASDWSADASVVEQQRVNDSRQLRSLRLGKEPLLLPDSAQLVAE